MKYRDFYIAGGNEWLVQQTINSEGSVLGTGHFAYSDFTELGSGFNIALKDLEIRGAGNLLGREQHGDILAVGLDMYLRILDKAIAGLSEEKGEEAPDVYLELDYSGYIPDSYIQNILNRADAELTESTGRTFSTASTTE